MEEFVKVIGAFAAIFAAYKVIVDVVLARSKKHRDEYQFAKDYLADLEDKTAHRYILEKGFRALSGDIYTVEEIRQLLSLTEPTKAILLRSSSNSMLEFDVDEIGYKWKGPYAYKFFRKIAAKLYISLYSIFAFIVVFPLLSKQNGHVIFDLNPITSVSFAIIAIYFVIKHTDYNDTIDFMKIVARRLD